MGKIITISREFGSGGRYVGRLVSEILNIPFYDEELKRMLVEQSNYSDEFIEKSEDIRTSSFLYNLSTEGVFMNSPYGGMAPSDRLFVLQNNIINELADKGPCVIIGRCGDYILRDREDVLRVFVTCDMPQRIDRCVKYYGIQEKDVEKALKKKDKARSSNYSYYTGGEWGAAKNYDITINSGSFGVEKCAEIIASLAK